MITKKSYLYDRFLYQIEILLLNLKIVENSRFFKDFCSKFQVFPGFQVNRQPRVYQISSKV